jgi:hypothetical protein
MRDTGASACLTCPPGYACTTTGIVAPTLLCSPGYFCTKGAITQTPTAASQGGGKCRQGYYCPEGSGFELQCPPGKACPNKGMSDLDIAGTNYDCLAGYYCILKAIVTDPTSSAEGGGECPAGHYCE